MKILKIYFCLILLGSAVSGATLEGVTRPSADVMISFTESGLITSVNVKEGSNVKRGQLLALLECEAERRELKRLEREASADVKLRKAQTEKAFFEKQLSLLRSAFSKGAVSDKELHEVQLSLESAKLDILEARFESQILKLKAEELESRLKAFELKSPIDGIVEKVLIEEGEASKVSEEHVRVVKINPLWVEVSVPLVDLADVRRSHQAIVDFGDVRKKGKIVFISPVADTASETVRIRLEVTNKNGRLAGEHVSVDFSGKNL